MPLDRDKPKLSEPQEICSFCGKPVAKSRGSLTGWLFAAARCNCQLRSDSVTSTVSTPIFDQIDFTNPRLSNNFVIISTLGQGGVGTVYKVQNETTKQIFAAKVLHPEYVRDPRALIRFDQEIEAAKLFDHRNLVKIYEKGKTAFGTPYFIMEYLDGKNLATMISEQIYIDEPHALKLFLQICDGIGYAHSKGLVHRDLKPSNVIVVKDNDGSELVKIVDFGIVKITSPDSNVTNGGDCFGSPNYMSPEQCQGNPVDWRSDIYSLGCCLYEMATGNAPFAAENTIKTVLKHVNESHIPIRQASPNLELSEGFEIMIDRMLVKDPNGRYQTIDEIKGDIKLIQTGKTLVKSGSRTTLLFHNKNKPKTMAAIAIGLLLVLILVGIATTIYWTINTVSKESAVSQDENKAGSSMSEMATAWTLDMVPTFKSRVDKPWGKYLTDAYIAMVDQNKPEVFRLRAKACEIAEQNHASIDELLELYEQTATAALNVEAKSKYILKAAELAKNNKMPDRQESDLASHGVYLEIAKRFDEAGRQYLEIAHLKRDRLGAEDSDYRKALITAGDAFYKGKSYAEGKNAFNELLENPKLGVTDKIKAYQYLGELEFMAQHVAKGKEYFKKAMELADESYGSNSPDTEKLARHLEQSLDRFSKTPTK
jgi:serine/threonine protein kinase